MIRAGAAVGSQKLEVDQKQLEEAQEVKMDDWIFTFWVAHEMPAGPANLIMSADFRHPAVALAQSYSR
jgi:hypothetical protein